MEKNVPIRFVLILVLLLTSLSAITSFAQSQGTEIAVIDHDLPDVEMLVRELRPGIKLVYFDKLKNLTASISEVLDANAPVSSLHIISHGNEGILFLTSGWLDADILQKESSEISQWKNKFIEGGDILLYGCNLAKGSKGQQFCEKLSQVTGLNIAASNNTTGSVARGGDWNLEVKIGNVQNALCFKPGIAAYDHLLANVVVYGGPGLNSYATSVANYYTGKGHTVLHITGATTLPDLTVYSIVFVIEPERTFNATEISYLMAHLGKGGRIVLTGEHSGFAVQNASVTADVLALGGHLSIQNLMLDGSTTYLPNTSMNMSSDLMEGCTQLWGSAASAVNIGGDAIVLNRSVTDPTKIVMAQERLGNGDIVAWADVNFWDKIGDASFSTAKFFSNLLDKAILNIQSKSIAELSTTEAYSVGGTSAYSGGNITNDKGSAIMERGICWSISSFSPTTSDNKLVGSGTGTGLFSTEMTGLSLNTKYYARAYAINGIGTAYGNTISFTTSSSSNTAPTAVADNFSCEKSKTITGNVMSNDFDADENPMTAHIVVTPSYTSGGFTLNSNGSFSYTHNGNSAAADFFSYYLTDDQGGTSSTVGVSIALFTPSNPPTGGDGSVNVTAGLVYSFSSTDFIFSDADAGHIFNGIRLGSVPAKGILKYNGFSVAAGSIYNDVSKLTFDNNGQAGGSPFTTFTFKVEASSGEESAATYTMSVMLTGGKSDQVITFGALPPIKYGDADFDPGASASSGLSVAYGSATPSVATIVDGKIHVTGAGTSIITASQSGDEGYNAAPDVTQTLTVDKSDQVITFEALTGAPFGDPDFGPGATSNSGLSVTYASSNTSVATIVGENIHITGAGTAVITASQAGNANYNEATDVPQTFIVSKANLSAKAENLSRTYGESNPQLIITYTGFCAGDDLQALDAKPSASTLADQSSNTGEYTISLSGGNDNNYALVLTDGVLTVKKAELIVTAEDKNKVYGDPNPSFTLSYSGFKNGDTYGGINSKPVVNSPVSSESNAGNYPLIVSGGIDNNYYFSYVDGEITVDKKTLNVTAENHQKIYGEENPSLTVSYNGFVEGEDDAELDQLPACTTTASAGSDAGSYVITPSGGSDSNYGIVYNDGNLTINRKSLEVKANNAEKTYGDVNPEFLLQFEGFVNGDGVGDIDTIPVGNSVANQSSDAGPYSIYAVGGNDNNYAFSYQDGILTVNKREITITPADQQKSYGDPLPALAFNYTGMVNGDNEGDIDLLPAVTIAADVFSPRGEYPVIASGAEDNNYSFNYVSGILTVNPRELAITAENKSIVYGEALPSLTWITEGFVQDDNEDIFTSPVEIQTSANENSDAGSYAISVSGAVSDDFYSITFKAGSLEISKAALTVTAMDQERPYAQENPQFSCTYDGFVKYQDQDVLDILPVASTEATILTPTGEYDIIPYGAEDQNYSFVYQNATLTIIKADQEIEFEAIPAGLRGSTSHPLVATAGSNLEISFTTSDPAVASIEGDQLVINREGTVTITAVQSGDNNWNATSASQTIETTPSFGNSDYLMTPNGDGINDFWHINYLEDYGKTSVLIYNRWGKKVYESSNYGNDWDGHYSGSLLPAGSYYFIIDSENEGIKKGVINIVY